MSKITSEYTAIDSLSITLIGNASAKLNINFKAELVTISSFKNIFNSESSWTTFLTSIIELIASYLISYITNKPIPQIGMSKDFSLPSSLLSAIFELQTSTVEINGEIDMKNTSNIPITAKVFAESLTITDNGKKQQIINPNKMFLAYEDQQLKRSSGDGDNAINIVPIQGATITSSVL